MRGVSREAVSKACRAGGALAAAVLQGGRVNAAHPAAVAWLARGAAGQAALVPPDDSTVAELLTAEDLVALSYEVARDRYGIPLLDWIAARRHVAAARRAELEINRQRGDLIPRELVKAHLFGAMDSTNRRLLLDLPKTMASKLYAACRSGLSLEEAELILRDGIKSQLEPMKTTVQRVMKNA